MLKKYKVFALVAALLVSSGTIATISAEVSEATLANWKKNCKKCHAEDGSGSTKIGKKLKLKDYTDSAVQEKLTDEEMFKATKEGVKIDGKAKMKPYAEKLTDEEINDLVALIRSFKKEG